MEEEKEELYESISSMESANRRALRKELGWDSEKLGGLLDELYADGIINIRGSTITPVDEKLAGRTYLERNLDMGYLRETVDLGLVDSLLEKMFGHIPKPAPAPAKGPGGIFGIIRKIKNIWEGTDKKLEDVSARVNELSSLHAMAKEVRELKQDYKTRLSERLGK